MHTSVDAARGVLPPQIHHESSTITLIAAGICLVWYIAVAFVCTVGYVQMYNILQCIVDQTSGLIVEQLSLLLISICACRTG